MSTMFDPHYGAAGNYYSAGASRIVKHLIHAGLPHPQPEPLKNALLEHFEDRDYLQARALLEKGDPSDWQMVVPGSHANIFQKRGLQLASSAEEGLAAILETCDAERLFPTRCEPTPDGLRLYSGDSLLVELRRINFEPYRADHRQRIDSALKGIRRFGEQERLVARLKTIPGFDSATFSLSPTRYDKPSGCMMVPSPGNWATAMLSVMEEVGTPVKRNIAQELVAKLFGTDSWQHLVARSDEERVWCRPNGVTFDESDPSAWRFYKTSSESAFAFAQTLRSWEGDALLVNDVSMSYSMDAGLYLAASPQATPDNEMSLPTLMCGPADPVESSDSSIYRALASTFLQKLASGDNPLGLLERSGDLDADIRTINARLGILPNQMLRLGNWWLHVSHSFRTYLHIERIADDGARTFRRATPLYKATVRYSDASRDLTVLGDYEGELVATIPNLSREEAEQVALLITVSPDADEPAMWGRGDIRGPAPLPEMM